MVINENHIKNIVSEALSSLLLELDMGVIGGAGPLTTSDMEDPSKIFEQEYNTLNSLKNGGKGAKVEKIFGETKAYKVWKNYYDAMMSKKGKKAVKFTEWLRFVCEGKHGQKIYAFSVDGSYLFGLWIDNFFLCAYFAPIGFSGMAKVIRGICQFNNVIFAVTQDMSPMLTRLGVPKADKTHDAPWRGKVVTKDVFGTSQKAIEKGFEILDFAVNSKTPSQDDIDVEKHINKETLSDPAKVQELMGKFQELNPEQQQMVREKVMQLLAKKGKGSLGNFGI